MKTKKSRGHLKPDDLGDEGAPKLAPLQEESMKSTHTNGSTQTLSFILNERSSKAYHLTQARHASDNDKILEA